MLPTGMLAIMLLAGLYVPTTQPCEVPASARESDSFSPYGSNEYLSIDPGQVWLYAGREGQRIVVLQVAVLDQIEHILILEGADQRIVQARVIEEREWIDGELAEVSRQYVARDLSTNDIRLFGEEVASYRDGQELESMHGWRAGRNGAQHGVLMPGVFQVGAVYHQAVAPPVAVDRARNLCAGITVEVPAGHFEDCAVVLETSRLEQDDRTIKIYSKTVGLIATGSLRLFEYTR